MLSNLSDQELQAIVDNYNPFQCFEDRDTEFDITLQAMWELEKRSLVKYMQEISNDQ